MSKVDGSDREPDLMRRSASINVADPQSDFVHSFQGWIQNRGVTLPLALPLPGVALPYTFKFYSLLVQMKLLAEGTELGNLQTN